MPQFDHAEEFPARLRATREKRKLEQIELSSLCGIPATSISHFEAGRRKPSLVNLRNLADALEVSIDYLLGRTDNPVAHVDAAAFRDERLYSKEDQQLLDVIKSHLAKRIEEHP